MGRSNEVWLTVLRSNGPDQQAALADLRDVLIHGLRRAFSNRAAADDSFLDDAVQDALVRILERLGQFEGRSRFLTWATSIAVRVAMSELRRRRWNSVSLEDVIADANFAPAQAVDDALAAGLLSERKAILDAMNHVIHNELTEKQRTVLLAELKGMPQDEIARQTGSNRNAVYKLTYDARKRLKQGLENAGYTADDIHAAFVK